MADSDDRLPDGCLVGCGDYGVPGYRDLSAWELREATTGTGVTR